MVWSKSGDFKRMCFLNGPLIKFYNSDSDLINWDGLAYCREQVKTNKPVLTDHISHTISSCLIHQEHFASYWLGETLDFVCILKEEPLATTIIKHTLSLPQEIRLSIPEHQGKNTLAYKNKIHVRSEHIVLF